MLWALIRSFVIWMMCDHVMRVFMLAGTYMRICWVAKCVIGHMDECVCQGQMVNVMPGEKRIFWGMMGTRYVCGSYVRLL